MWLPSRAEGACPTVTPVVGVAAVLVVVLAYANAVGAGFQFDDWNVIVREPRVQSLAAWWGSMPGIRPLLKLSYALNHATALGAPGFHAVNIAVHVINAGLVFALLRRWPGGAPVSTAIAAIIAALIFALHPVQTEAVSWVAGLSVSLSATFVLSSLLAWVAGRERGSRLLSGALSPLLFVCALATRETAAVLPLALILWRVTAGSPPGDRVSALRSTAMHWVMLAIAAVAALALPDYRRFFATAIEARPLYAQVLTQVNAVGYLAGQLVRFDRLNADPMLPVLTTPTPAVIIEALALAAVLALGFVNLRRRPAVAFGVLWFFLWLAPTNSLLPRLDVVNDRQLYLALIGPAWLAGLGIGTPWRRWPRAVGALTAALMIGLAVATYTRNEVYADEVVFWQDVVRKSPWNSRAFNNLGYAWALAGHNADAERAFRQALAIDPANTKAAVNLRLLRDGALLRRDDEWKSQ
jgi:hypothetical protein